MADDAVSRLQQIDLGSITLSELRELKNPALRDSLLELVRMPDDVLAVGHQNHGSHSNHSTESAEWLRLRFRPGEVRDADVQ